jgi:hypothetical protein
MKRTISLWALIGLAVASAWLILGWLTSPFLDLGRSTAVAVTVPVSLLGRVVPLKDYWVILLNAATYALFGLAIAQLRRQHR